MMLKKGEIILRDIVFMMFIVSAIFIFAGLFVSEMAYNYDNTNMSGEWDIGGTNIFANQTFYETSSDMNETATGLSGGVWSLVSGVYKSIGTIITMILTAPNTIASLVTGILEDFGLATSVAKILYYLITGIFWAIIIFVVYSFFAPGGNKI